MPPTRASSAVYPSLARRHVLITGGASGIGAALVDAFCAQGAIVSFIDIADQDADAVSHRNAARGFDRPRYLRCDVTDTDALKASVADAISQAGPITALINNAAHDERHDWRTLTSSEWDARMAVNLKHQFFTIQATADHMARAGGGSIVNFSSIAWLLSLGGMPVYVAAKAAVVALTRSFARDLGTDNIRVNCVLPGQVMTPRQRALYVTPEVEQSLMEKQCIARPILPEEVASLVLFLAADDSAACTSQSFIIDRGWT